ncbi:MAG: NAD(P)/FAD-dependent oxidoreductase [Hyphomonadaceae bacterium]|jgi:NADPH-dependent 2,4-dienoyl-CoA reductase/sulfur reductase-like enzyme|nr:NAD(P)/FAD-dependent oxidoreductase [Hyphomonadaceae bacterium]
MRDFSRRDFGKLAGAAGAGTLTSVAWGNFAIAQGAAKVVIVGGGAGGATVAHFVKKEAPNLDVTLIEANVIYSSSFFSNLYIGGFRTLESLNHGYAGLRRLGIKVVHDFATDVDSTKKIVRTRGGRTYAYDRLVLSPGIDIKYETITGYSRDAARGMPHAYNTNATQKRLLKQQLQGMRDGGTVVMVMPNNPFRCPPGPYERACMIAHILKTRKPKSKLVILDPKRAFSKQPVFTEAFDKYYKSIIDLNLSTEIDDYSVISIDPKTKEVVTRAGKKVRADVANIIPQQRAGEIAAKAGVAEGDWCPINAENFSSRKVRDIYVLGDAAIAAEMPKSAFSANSQAKVVASDIVAALAKKDKFEPRYRNTCWSLLAPDDNVKIGANYTPKDGKLDPSGSFVSQRGETADVRKQNYQESIAWYDSITAEMFAKPGPAAAAKKAG